jgi:hypothetical protein
MSARLPALLAATSWLSVPTAAQAFCEYRGQLYAKTSLAQEFRDSRWVVRARVTRERVYQDCADCPGRLYDLETVTAYKGDLPRNFTFYTPQNSGGFYLHQGKAAIGSEWLLFLNAGRWGISDPTAARGAARVNYNCGQSAEWRTIDTPERTRLSRFARQR